MASRYRKSELLGKNILHSKAMQKILRKDTKHVLNQRKEQVELFNELKKYREGGVSGGEMRKVLAEFKYRTNSLSKKEARVLADELGVSHVEKKCLSEQESRSTQKQISRLSHAKHEVDFLAPENTRSHSYSSRTDKKSKKKSLHELSKKSQEEEDDKLYRGYTSMRPDHRESYMSMQYRGTSSGSKSSAQSAEENKEVSARKDKGMYHLEEV